MNVAIDPDLPPLVLIPARGGSKGIPGKNLRPVGAVPLLARTIRAARSAQRPGAVWVSSDDDAIGALAEQEGAGWLRRPARIAGDQASSETALAHGLLQLAQQQPLPALFAFLQCTSPFTTGPQIDTVIEALLNSQAAMAFSVTQWHGFLWQHDGLGHGIGINHDAGKPRQRRQEIPPTFLETGAIYVIRTAPFLEQLTRFVQPVLPVPIAEPAPEIDTPEDLALCELLAPLLDSAHPATHGDRGGLG
ncbi:MAG: acylneuraminate cytidylyltransferase family protein [Cyanobacteria bacterium K_DeepCast_0m_m1_088]|nr:acylneuraminate cytidylyltransferase family protein [Cyanobacteria bacterium K_DeepCast_0m_m1_088]